MGIYGPPIGNFLPPNPGKGQAPSNEPVVVGDLFSPFFRLKFTNLTGRPGEIEQIGNNPASIRGEPQQVTDLAGDDGSPTTKADSALILKTVASMVIESRSGSPYMFTLELTPTYEDAMRILNSQLITFSTLVSVVWGYVMGDGTEIATANHVFRNMHPKVDFGEDIKIVVHGQDLVAGFAIRNTSLRQWLRALFPTDLDILKFLVARVGHTLDEKLIPANSSIRETITDPPGVEQLVTDWAFIQHLCRKHALAFQILGDDVFQVMDMFSSPAIGLKTYYRLLWRQRPVTKFDIPLYGVTGNIYPFIFQPPASRGILAIHVDNETGVTSIKELDGRDAGAQPVGASTTQALTAAQIEANSVVLSKFGEDNKPLTTEDGKAHTPTPKGDSSDTGEVISFTERLDKASSRAASRAKEAQVFAAPQVRIRCPGVIGMAPGVFVQLIGTSKIFDAHYRVLSVKHTLSSGGYDMEAELFRLSTDSGGTTGGPAPETQTTTSPEGGQTPEPTKNG
jgi:hypothetical protein